MKILVIFSLLYSSLSFAEFTGRVATVWLEHEGEDRKMQLIESITYTDPNRRVWHVPAGAVIDGASIPRIFWISVGPPFVGDYRKASVIHDYYCDYGKEEEIGSREVHRMFFDALLDSDVDYPQARAMYAAVAAGGPSWTVKKGRGFPPSVEIVDRPPVIESVEELEALHAEIAENNLNPDEVDQLIVRLRRQKAGL